MNHQEISEIVGSNQHISLGGLILQVQVKDHKVSYGKDRWLVTPVAGSKEVWVEDFV